MMRENKLDMLIDNAEHFLGEVLDEEKMVRLIKLRAICRKIEEAEPCIKYKAYPFSNRNRNGMVILDFPQVLFCTDRRVISSLSAALAISDNVSASTLCGNLRLSFGIHDMWSKYGYDNDMEHG